MQNDDQPTNGEAWLPFLKRKGRFAEFTLLSWQFVEDMMDQMVIQQFELFNEPEGFDPRIDLLRETPFRKKLELLTEMGRLSKVDAEAIRRFATERNKLFHGNVFALNHPVMMPKAKKELIMELGDKAARIAQNRGVGVWMDEGTNDVGNKGVPQPDRHPALKKVDEIRRLFESVSKLDDKRRNPPKIDSE